MRRQIGVAVVSALVWSAVCGGCGSSAPVIKAGSMPEGGEFTGVYFSQQYGQMNLIQNGSSVVGEYESEMRAGKIQGEVQGDLLRFEWNEEKAMVSNRAQNTKGRGYFRYMIDSGNGQHVLKGEWGLGSSETGGGPWNAYKQKGKEPKLKHASSGGESEGGSSSGDESGGSEEKEGDDLF